MRYAARRLNRPSLPTLICMAVPGLAFVLFLLPLPHAWAAGWRGELINRLHVPVMGVCFAAFAGLLCRSGPWQLRKLLVAAVCAVVMAALVEVVQPWFGRTASVADFGWGMAGMLGGCVWFGAVVLQSVVWRRAVRLLAVACVLAPPLAWVSESALMVAEANRVFPLLVDDEHPRLQPLWSIEPAATDGSLSLARNADHPASLHLDALDRDWSGYDVLEIAGELEAAAAVEVGVRLDLGAEGQTRLRAGGMMQPGTGVIQIPWPTTVRPDCVHQLVVFLAAQPTTARLRIRHLRLIKREKNGAL